MDPLADVLTLAGVRSAVGARIAGGEDWGWWFTGDGAGASFHAVTAGTAWVAVSGQDPIELMPGDVFLLPRGDSHAIGSDRDAVARTSTDRFDAFRPLSPGAVALGTGPTRAQILCAHYGQDPAIATQVMHLLPAVVHVRGASATPALERTVGLLGQELTERRLGSEVVLGRLVDVLLVQVLRAWIDEARDGAVPSWLLGFRDPVVLAAVSELHARPADPWTSETLAAAVSVSRATLARRFDRAIGESPVDYLTRWRMDLAVRRLRDTDDALDVIGRSIGYASAPAFNRAFRRARGVSPGRFRTAARAARVPG